ncbi:DAB adaptor protein isoform X1 [Xylocopa sonorina]|uniref:DAB adaptor protein isoform X1 n=1 Tax=Xylocopa sonorina TaxID=1818115 RepID=UPI00403AA12C
MQTLRKKNSPCKLKNEPTRFIGEGVSFKAKLIGILEVSEARGDRMCQAALADLKMAIRAAGEHKQRIIIQVSIEGIRLRDEKSGDCLYQHPVHRISFISHDMTDSRAFGYIFGSPDTGHRFFGIKTDKAASQVVMAMRDLFQVVFELKKKEVEQSKQNAINVIKFHTSGIFVEPIPDTKGAAGSDSSLHRVRNTNSEIDKPADKRNESQSDVIADLLDLQFELNSLQQGIHHMDKITPENPLPSAPFLFEIDPFGDSFVNMKPEDTVRPILPPPPSSSKRGQLERQQTVPAPQSSVSSSPATTISSKTPPLQSTIQWFDKETENLFSDSEPTSSPKNTPVKKDVEEVQATSPQIDVFTELDPLGTGLIKPYVDKKDFFQHLKNPPKKVLKDLVSTNSADTFPTSFNAPSEPLESASVRNDLAPKDNQFEDSNFANFDRFDENEVSQPVFARTDSTKKTDTTSRSAHHQPLSVSLPPEDPSTSLSPAISTVATSGGVSLLGRIEKDSTESMHGLIKLPSPIKSTRRKEVDIDLASNKPQSIDKPFPVDFSTANESPASPLKSCSSDANSRLSTSSAELELVPEPPPRGVASILINPPPLPPKKQGVRGVIKPPPRPPHTDTYFHYDFPEREPVATKQRTKSPSNEIKSQFDDNFSPPIHLSSKSDLIGSMTTSTFEDSFSSMVPTTNLSTFFTNTSTPTGPKKTKPSLDITLSQLTTANLNELASSLGMTVQELTSLTLQQLTECLATLSVKEAAASDTEESVSAGQEEVQATKPQTVSDMAQTKISNDFQPFAKMNAEPETKQDATYDKYAVFRELLELEQMEKNEESAMKDSIEEETSSVTKEEPEVADQQQEATEDGKTEILTSLVNLTVKLPPSNEDLSKEEPTDVKPEESTEPLSEKAPLAEPEKKAEPIAEFEPTTEFLSPQVTADAQEEPDRVKSIVETEEKAEDTESVEKRSDSNEDSDKPVLETTLEETSGPLIVDKVEVKLSISTSSDRYAALREIIGEPEPPIKQTEEDASSSTRMSPVIQPSAQSKTSTEVELLNLFSDTPPPSSPKKEAKQEEKPKIMGLDIFEEIKMLNTGAQSTKKTKSLIPEDIFCPFTELKPERDDGKDDGNWAKFDTGLFVSDSGISQWSPDSKEFHKEATFKGSAYRQSGDSDNEWKDEEESEESSERLREARLWCSRHPRFDAPFGDRDFYEETGGGSGSKRDRNFRDRMMEKSRDVVRLKISGHRVRDPTSWHDENQWDKESKRYPHRKMPYKDEEEQYEAHWKCRVRPQRWAWPHEHGPFYDDERKRKMMLWKEDRFDSQESMSYEDEHRWSRRCYERRRWEEDARFWNRRAGLPDTDYPSRESYYYYREGRERPHDYVSAWDEEYGSDRPGDDSPRYSQSGRKRHWPKRPNSANEGRNADMGYTESRNKFGTSRSECSDNDSDLYPRSSQRSRSRESYWGSDQEYDAWVDRPCWSEGPDTKSESLQRKRIPRHKPRHAISIHSKTQSPFEDDFAQSIEHTDPSPESITPAEPRVRSEGSEPKPPPPSPSFASRYTKGSRRAMPMEEVYSKRSSYFEDDLTPSASGTSDTSDRQRLSAELKATPEELPCDTKEANQTADVFVSEDNGRDSFFNGDLRYDDDDAFTFKSELDDNISDHRATTLPLKNHGKQGKYPGGSNNNNNNNKSRTDQYIRKSESVNIFVRENDPFDDDDFFN